MSTSERFVSLPNVSDAKIAAAWIKSGLWKVDPKTHCLMYSVHTTHTTHCMLKITGCPDVNGR